MKDHSVNCERRILGSSKCTCGAPEESYPTTTTNRATDVETLVPRVPASATADVLVPPTAAPKVAAAETAINEDRALRVIREEMDTYLLMDNKEAAFVAHVLKRLIARIEGKD